MRKLLQTGLLVIVMTLAAACAPGPAAKPTEPPRAAAPTASPATSASPAASPPTLQLAITDAARRTGLDPGAVRVVSVQAREWSDSSLGCPKPGQMYAQVITPGYLIVLEAGGQRLEYHSDASRRVESC